MEELNVIMLTIFAVGLGKPSNTTLQIFSGRTGRVCILQTGQACQDARLREFAYLQLLFCATNTYFRLRRDGLPVFTNPYLCLRMLRRLHSVVLVRLSRRVANLAALWSPLETWPGWQNVFVFQTLNPKHECRLQTGLL